MIEMKTKSELIKEANLLLDEIEKTLHFIFDSIKAKNKAK